MPDGGLASGRVIYEVHGQDGVAFPDRRRSLGTFDAPLVDEDSPSKRRRHASRDTEVIWRTASDLAAQLHRVLKELDQHERPQSLHFFSESYEFM